MNTMTLEYLLECKCPIRRGDLGENIQMTYPFVTEVRDGSRVTLSRVLRLQYLWFFVKCRHWSLRGTTVRKQH